MVLTLLGAIREIVGKGTLLSGIDLVLGSFGFHEAKQWVLTVIPDYHGFLLAVLPPGAFIGLACLIAGKNYLDQRRTSAPVLTEHPVPAH